jgi:uncharacterized membrane protein
MLSKYEAYNDYLNPTPAILVTRKNKKTGVIEQVDTTGKVVANIVIPNTTTSAKSAPSAAQKRHDDAIAAYEASKSAPATNTSTATAPVEKPKAKTTAPKAEANPYTNVTTAEIDAEIAKLKAQE